MKMYLILNKNMLGNSQICSLCRSEPISYGCVCEAVLKLICDRCLQEHLRNTKSA